MSLIPLMLCNTTVGAADTQPFTSRQGAARSNKGAAKSQRVGPLEGGHFSLEIKNSYREKKGFSMKTLPVVLLFAVMLIAPAVANAAADFDEAAARNLAKKSGCLKCHAIDKKKDAPSYTKIATEYKGKADAEDKLYKHATTNPEVEVDGKKETHDSPKTKDEKQIRNLIRWILSLAK